MNVETMSGFAPNDPHGLLEASSYYSAAPNVAWTVAYLKQWTPKPWQTSPQKGCKGLSETCSYFKADRLTWSPFGSNPYVPVRWSLIKTLMYAVGVVGFGIPTRASALNIFLTFLLQNVNALSGPAKPTGVSTSGSVSVWMKTDAMPFGNFLIFSQPNNICRITTIKEIAIYFFHAIFFIIYRGRCEHRNTCKEIGVQ